MNVYPSKDIRNVAVVGHSHSGKTTLVEALLATSGAIATMGRVENGTAVTAYGEEDAARQMTLANAMAFCEWNGVKINWIDTPGFPLLKYEARAAMLPVEMALVVVDASDDLDHGIGGGGDEGMGDGIDAMTRRVWGYAQEFNLPRLIVINRVDHEHADPLGVLEQLRISLGGQVMPVQWPIGLEDEFHISEGGLHESQGGLDEPEGGIYGVIDLVTLQAYAYDATSTGHGKQIPIPRALAAQAHAAHAALIEKISARNHTARNHTAGNHTAGNQKHAASILTDADVIPALRAAIREGKIFPVMFAAGLNNFGCDRVLEFLRVYTPAPTEREPVAATVAAQASAAVMESIMESIAGSMTGSLSGSLSGSISAIGEREQREVGQTEWPIELVTRAVSDNEPLALFAFKTLSDPTAGQISFFKIFSGCAHDNDTVMHHKLHLTEKLAHLSVMQGKRAVAVSELHAGDIGAVPRLKNTRTGDTLGDKNHPIFYEPIG